ncbi:hypothetical protein [Aliivibrio salmonicida]|uniref:hypothetical protein n=1 Tax=Aliivibrio salmonicida TaxID=40269 RepID=UPI003D14E9DF
MVLSAFEKISLQTDASAVFEQIKTASVFEKLTHLESLSVILSKLDGSHKVPGTEEANQESEHIDSNEDTESLGMGNVSIVFTPKGDEIKTAYKIVELSKIIPSHTEDGRINSAYSEELQPRDRERKSSFAQVDKIAGNLNPKRLTSSDLTSHGSPIVGKDLMVESGNGRTMAIIKAYKSNKAEEYKDHIVNVAAKFGFKTASIAAMEQPILVRVRLTKLDREKFARDSNSSDLQSMSATEQAFADAQSISDHILGLFNPSDDGNLFGVSNRSFVDAFINEIGLEASAGLFDSAGIPNKQLRERMKAAIFVKAYKNKALAELAIESDDPEITNIINALGFAANEFTEMQAINGELHKQLSDGISDSVVDFSQTNANDRSDLASEALGALVRATELVREAKQKNVPLESLLDQNDMFSTGDPAAEALAMFIKSNNRSAKRMAFAFKSLAKEINNDLINQGSAIGDLFGEPQDLTLIDVLTRVNIKVISEFGNDAKTIEIDRLDVQANAAATSDSSSQNQPTTKQKEVGNYKKGRVKFAGFDIAIENPKGSTRSGTAKDGSEWKINLKHHYGDLMGTKGADGDPLDVFIGDNSEFTDVYIADQIDPNTRKFDEHKIMLGFNSKQDARKAYLINYDENWQGLGALSVMSLDKFKQWVSSGNTKSAINYKAGDFQEKTMVENTEYLNPVDYESINSLELKKEMFKAEEEGHTLESISAVMDHWLIKNPQN